VAPGVSYGMAAREVGADAAIAAGIAHQGPLERDSALHVFALAAANKATGRLTLGDPAARAFALSIRKGVVEHAASTDPTDDLGRFLLRKGVLTPEKLLQADGARAAAGGDLAGALVATGLVNPAEVAGVLQEHGNAIVGRALAAEAGEWRWEPNVPPPASAFPLGSPFTSLCTAVRALDLAAVKRRLGDREERSLSRVAGRVRVEDLRLTPQEARSAALYDGVRSPAEVAAATPADAATALRVALLLLEVDAAAAGPVRKAAAPRPAAPPAAPPIVAATPTTPAATPAPGATAAVKPAGAPPKPAAAPTLTPKPAAPTLTPRPAAAPTLTPKPTAPTPKPGPAPLDPAALHALLAKLQGKDHFDVLAVKKDTPAPQVKIAYFQLAKLYHPDAVPAAAPADVKKLCADVFARVSEAWSVVSDEGQRAQYLKELESGGAADVDVMAILQAENVFQAGTGLVKARRYEEARAKLDEAMKLNPDEAEFGMWKAWCEFLIAPDKKQKHASAASVIEAALKKNPRCAPGYLFLGQMAKLVGDVALAEKHLKRGLQVSPDHQDLARELKYLRK
jgi:hypothetical protein